MTEQTTPTHMTQAEFARHRGVSRPTVSEYKRKGLLVMKDERLVDVVASEARLASSLDQSRGGDRSQGSASGKKKPAAGGGAYMAAKIRGMEAVADRQELETKKLANELLEREETHRKAFTLARNAQESMMGIADRMAPLLAAEADPAKVHAMLSDELRNVAQDLAKAAKESLQ